MTEESKKILIVKGGDKKPLERFVKEAADFDFEVVVESFSKLEYLTQNDGSFILKIAGIPLDQFSLVYIRLVGKRHEDAALLLNYLKNKNIRVVDRMFLERQPVNVPLTKAVETKLLVENKLPVPKTYFASVKRILEKGEKYLGFPFLIKETTSSKARGVWIVNDVKELDYLVKSIKNEEKNGKRFLAQEFIKASQRIRALVVGEKVIGGLIRPMKWRRVFIENPGEGVRTALPVIPKEDEDLALKACASLGVDIAGVDIVHEDKTGKPFILEVNPAPSWRSVREDVGVNVEREILKYLGDLIR